MTRHELMRQAYERYERNRNLDVFLNEALALGYDISIKITDADQTIGAFSMFVMVTAEEASH